MRFAPRAIAALALTATFVLAVSADDDPLVAFQGLTDEGPFPLSPQLAVGPDHLVQTVHHHLAFFTKNGLPTHQETLDDFWAVVGATGKREVTQPIFDPRHERFVLVASEYTQTASGPWLLVAVSDDADPNGAWHRYRLDLSPWFTQYMVPGAIAVDESALVVYGGGFHDDAPVFDLITIDLASLLVGAPPAIMNVTPFAPQVGWPVRAATVARDDAPVYGVATPQNGDEHSTLEILAFRDPLDDPVASSIIVDVPTYAYPASAPQPGGRALLTEDMRIRSVAVADGTLWVAHHVGHSIVRVRWYEIDLNGWPNGGLPTLAQWGEILPVPLLRTHFPAVAVDPFGNTAMVYSQCASTAPITMETAFRFVSDPLGAFHAGTERRASTTWAQWGWGRHVSIEVDPFDEEVFWATHIWTDAQDVLRSWIVAFSLPFPVGDVTRDGAVRFDDLLEVLAGWGPCDGCRADVDGSGVVDFQDTLLVLSNWTG